MRRTLIPIAVGIGLGVFVAAFLGYFVVSKESTYWVDGLGRPLGTAPWLARFVFGTDKEWAGWSWFFLDLLWFWGGIGLAVFFGSLAGERPASLSFSKTIVTVASITIALGTAYLTQRAIKVGVTLGLDAGLGFKSGMASESAPAEANLPFVTFHRWSEFTERQQEIYVQGLSETWSFKLYGMADREKSSGEFSAFTACAETEKTSRFTVFLINNPYAFGKIDKSPVVHFLDNLSIICSKYIGKGDQSWRPVRLLRRVDWEKFNDQEQKIYLMAYVDLIHFVDRRILTGLTSKEQSNLDQATLRFLNELKNDLQALEKCLVSNGIEGLFTTMSKLPIQWQHPLPWSVASALGNTCKRFLR